MLGFIGSCGAVGSPARTVAVGSVLTARFKEFRSRQEQLNTPWASGALSVFIPSPWQCGTGFAPGPPLRVSWKVQSHQQSGIREVSDVFRPPKLPLTGPSPNPTLPGRLLRMETKTLSLVKSLFRTTTAIRLCL